MCTHAVPLSPDACVKDTSAQQLCILRLGAGPNVSGARPLGGLGRRSCLQLHVSVGNPLKFWMEHASDGQHLCRRLGKLQSAAILWGGCQAICPLGPSWHYTGIVQ
jgi:hypothetical protein